MADATQGDTDIQSLGLLVLVLINLIAGLLIHSFIIGVNVSDWWKGRSVTAVDHIVTSLGISRICSQCADTLYLFVIRFFLSSLESIISLSLGAVCAFFTYANIWVTSLLSIVLCLKISNFHSRLFLYLRGMILHRTGSLIGASALLSAFSTFIPVTTVELFRGEIYNTTMANLVMNYTNNNFIYCFCIGSFIPFLFYYISSVLLFASLYHHTMQMKLISNSSINLETYYSVMRLVSFTVLYNTVYFFAIIACIFYYFIHHLNLDWVVTVLGILPVLHSSYLIYKTVKLRSQMSKVLQNLIDFLFQRKNTETRENIEMVTQQGTS